MSNTFITPRVVTTIAQSRLDYNQSLTSVLQNFASTGAPDALSVNLEGATGLKTGMFWYKSGSTTSDGQGRLFVYDGSSFTRNGIGTYQMSSATDANNAASSGRIEYGDLVLIGTDDLYLVTSTGTSVKRIGEAASTLSGLVATQFLRSDIDSIATGNVRFASNNFVTVPIGTTAQRPIGTAAQPGQIRFNTVLASYEGYNGAVWGPLSNSSAITSLAANIVFTSNNFISLPIGTTAQRPTGAAAQPGQIRFNTEAVRYEGYLGSEWVSLSSATQVSSNSSNISANVVFSSDDGVTLYSNNNFKFNPSTGTLSATIFNSTSDANLKENIREIPDALDRLEMLSGYLFNFIGQSKDSAGLLAQELQEVLPQCVHKVDGTLQVNYAGALALVLQGFKEYREYMNNKIDYIESKLDER